jgi:hypothetical protein
LVNAAASAFFWYHLALASPETESDRERAHAFRVQTPSILDEFGRIHAPNFRKRMAFQKKNLKYET